MVSARTPRVFNLYDVLGVFFPGTALLVGLFVVIPGLPMPDSVISYLAFIIIAFSFGHILQSYASLCTGDLRIFDETIRNVQSPLDLLSVSDDDDRETDEVTGEADAEIEEETDEADAEIEEETDEADAETDEADESEKSNRFWLYVLYSLLGPLFWPILTPNGGAITELRNPNRVWMHLSKNYDFDPGSTRYEEMLQVISSRIDDPESPARSYRFQAIRNFHRGMWVTAWILFAVLVVTSIHYCISEEAHLLAQSSLLSHVSMQLALLLGGVTVIIFWLLTVLYERLFIRFLITDYVVLMTQNDQIQRIELVEDN